MKTRWMAFTLLGAAFLAGMLGSAHEAAAAYDVEVKFLAPVNMGGATVAAGKPITFRVQFKNNGPDQLPAGYKVGLSKFDHTGQQFIKEIGTPKDLPRLTQGQFQTYVFVEDNPGVGSFFYKPGITGTPLFSDSNNANNRPDIFLKFAVKASLALHAGVASNVATPDGKHRFTAVVQEAYQDATTTKRFRFIAQRGTGGASEQWETTTNAPNATWIKDPALAAGTYTVHVTVWIKQGAADVQTITKNLPPYVVP